MPGSKPDPHGNDLIHDNLDYFISKEVVVSCKIDGESTSAYRDKLHARSIDSGYHPSRTWIKGFHATFKHLIPENWRVVGENLQAKHAILYHDLPSYFFVFGIYNQDNMCLSWDDIEQWCRKSGLLTVPVLYRGIWDEEKVKACFTGRTVIDGVDVGEQEGFVCRVTNSFHYDDFAQNSYKMVRPGHVAGDTEHWSKTGYMPNGLKKER